MLTDILAIFVRDEGELRTSHLSMADAARVVSSGQASSSGAPPKDRLDNQVLHLLYVREVRGDPPLHIYVGSRSAMICWLS
jgi:hypothetical protein